jgi:hypothetical protein
VDPHNKSEDPYALWASINAWVGKQILEKPVIASFIVVGVH